MRLIAEPFILPIVSQINYFFLVTGLLWIPAILIASILAVKLFPKSMASDVVQALMLVIVIFYLTRWSVNEQYMIYLLAFLLIDVALWHPERRALLQLTWMLGLIFLAVNNLLFIRFFGPVIPAAVDYDYFLDNASMISGLRLVLLDALGIIFSIHLVQLALVLTHPKTEPTPWFFLLFEQLLNPLRSRPPKVMETSRGV